MPEKFKGEFKLPKPELEKSKEKGINVTVHAIFMRHGEKEISPFKAETILSERGRRESKEYGESLEKRGAIKSYASDTERTEKTAELLTKASPTEKKMTQKVKGELGFRYLKDGPFFQEVMKIKEETLGEDFDKLSEGEQKKRIRNCETRQTDYYLSFGDKRPDSGTYSPVETAAMVAKRVDIYTRMTDRLYSNSDIDLINVSHDFPISAFLKEMIVKEKDEEKIKGFESIEEIGGPIGYNEGFEILIKTDDQGERSVKMNFRGQEYQVGRERLDELVKIAKELEKEETE